MHGGRPGARRGPPGAGRAKSSAPGAARHGDSRRRGTARLAPWRRTSTVTRAAIGCDRRVTAAHGPGPRRRIGGPTPSTGSGPVVSVEPGSGRVAHESRAVRVGLGSLVRRRRKVGRGDPAWSAPRNVEDRVHGARFKRPRDSRADAVPSVTASGRTSAGTARPGWNTVDQTGTVSESPARSPWPRWTGRQARPAVA